MAHIVILGAGLGGSIMAYELADQIRKEDRITVVTKDPAYHFVPSNPWVAVGWRKREDITVDLAETMRKKGIEFRTVAAEKLHPEENRIARVDGSSINYDYLIIATGPGLPFDEIQGLGPHGGHTQSICQVDHGETAWEAFEALCRKPAPSKVPALQSASCFGAASGF